MKQEAWVVLVGRYDSQKETFTTIGISQDAYKNKDDALKFIQSRGAEEIYSNPFGFAGYREIYICNDDIAYTLKCVSVI